MVLINKAINEVTVKLVYYGPGLCGKTTNLEKIYANPKLDNKGKMISMSTETDRTLFFDFMPMELGTIHGQKVRVQLYTVPGQVFYDATRKLVLRGADGVVFVADSQNTMRDSNIDSLENLKTNLRLNRLDPDKVALVLQYNKRDLPNVDTVEDMDGYLNPGNVPSVEASAIKGVGVTATLRAAVARILDNLKNNVDTTLHDEPALTAPDMSARAGVTSRSAGTPKLSMKKDEPAAAPPAAAPQMPPPQPARAASQLMAQAPFTSALAAEPVTAEDSNPFAVNEANAVEAAVETAIDAALEDDPFGESVSTESSAPVADDAEDPFASPTAEVHDGDAERMELDEMLANARAMVASLEAALERARANERVIAARMSRTVN